MINIIIYQLKLILIFLISLFVYIFPTQSYLSANGLICTSLSLNNAFSMISNISFTGSPVSCINFIENIQIYHRSNLYLGVKSVLHATPNSIIPAPSKVDTDICSPRNAHPNRAPNTGCRKKYTAPVPEETIVNPLFHK
jgi:hypothetical protein